MVNPVNAARMRQNIYAVTAALIWGTAFAAQSVASDLIPPMAFNAARSAIACAAVALVSRLFPGLAGPPPEGASGDSKRARRDLALGGLCCGAFMAVASILQQSGIGDSGAGKAGFVTALYVVLVPVFGIVLGKRAPVLVWAGVVLAVAGLYLLCVKPGSFSIERSDLLLLLCAVFFTMQILSVDYFSRKVDCLRLSCVQFLVMTVISLAGMLLFEQPSWENAVKCLPQLLYVGIFSSGVAYTLQILAQREADATVVTLLMSLESVFSVLAGALLLGERLNPRELAGCGLMFAAVVLAQIPFPLKRKK